MYNKGFMRIPEQLNGECSDKTKSDSSRGIFHVVLL